MVNYEIYEFLLDEAREMDSKVEDDIYEPEEAGFMLGYELDALKTIEG